MPVRDLACTGNLNFSLLFAAIIMGVQARHAGSALQQEMQSVRGTPSTLSLPVHACMSNVMSHCWNHGLVCGVTFVKQQSVEHGKVSNLTLVSKGE